MTAPRILLLDSDPFSLGALYAPLTVQGCRVFRCRPRDLADAHAVVRRAGADLVILDRWLARGADGWALLGRLRADPETAHIPAILASDTPEMPQDAADRARAMRCRVMAKPFDAADLRAAIAAALRPSTARRDRGARPPAGGMG